MLRHHIFVSGKVQGVFYRSFTKDWALKLNIKGWVRNLPDGRVEAILEGNKKNLDALIDELKVGPAHSKVEKIDIYKENYSGEFMGFNIDYYD